VRSLAKLGQKFGHFHSGTIAFSRSGISCITVGVSPLQLELDWIRKRGRVELWGRAMN
jgi:hypothetical protein